MKRSLIAVAALLVSLMLSAPLMAQRQQTIAGIPFSPAPYRVGERLTYNVSFSNFSSAAIVELSVAGRGQYFNREGFQLRAHVETIGVVNAALYAVNNDYTSYVDSTTGLPFRAQQVIREAGRTADSSRDYNLPAGTSAIPSKVSAGGFPGTFDFLSALYRLRALPLSAGSIYNFTVSGEAEQYDAELKVIGSEMIKSNVGSFNSIVTQVRVPRNSAANNYRMRIYFSDDERHVPVLMTARHPAGEIRAELAGSEMLPVTPPVKARASQARTAIPPLTVAPPAEGVVIPPSQRPSPAGSSPASSAAGSTDDLPFKVGEQLNFNVFLGGGAQPAGTASFQVRSRGKYFNRDGFLLTVRAQTTSTVQRLFFASDQINSYVDSSTLLPFRTELALIEGSRRSNQTLSIDQDHGALITGSGQRIEVPVGTHDYVSALYALRSFDLAPPKRNAVSLIVNNRPHTLFITSLRRETITLGGQSIPAVQLSLTTDDAQSDKYALRLWVSNDKRRLPLRITAMTQLGPLRADLAIIPLTTE